MKRLYNAVCMWLEADATAKGYEAEPQAEGNNFAQSEHAHSYTSQPEMHAGHRGQSIDDDDGGAYRLGFQRNTTRGDLRAAETFTHTRLPGTVPRAAEDKTTHPQGES